MKRSDLNGIIEEAIRFCGQMKFMLPPFAFWTLEDWQSKGSAYDEIKDNMLGWDITDFGSGNFQKVGLLIFTLRNGNFTNPKYVKPYCEKILIQAEDQVLPSHYHYKKIEDIINRGGGTLLVQLYNSADDGQYTEEKIHIAIDGREYTAKSSEIIHIHPGESITLMPGQYHKFWAEEGTGKILLGEVSTVNDDREDNHFHDYGGRLPDIIEDEKPRYLIFNDYHYLNSTWPDAWTG